MTSQLASTEIATRTAAVVNDLKSLEGPLLPILHGIQDEFGYVPGESLPVIADLLNLSRAEVHGVVTFYHDYRNHPAGRHVLKLCRAESCQARGSDALAAWVQDRLGVSFGERLRIALAFFTNRKRRFPIPLSDPSLFTASPEGQSFIAADPLGLREATAPATRS